MRFARCSGRLGEEYEDVKAQKRRFSAQTCKNNSNHMKYVIFFRSGVKDTRRPFAGHSQARGTKFHSLLRFQLHVYKEDNILPLFITYIHPKRQIKIPQCKKLMNNQY